MATAIEQSALGIYHMTGNQSIPQYTNWVVSMTYNSSPGVPVNLSTYTGKLQVKQNYDGPVLLELNTTNGGITLSSGAGSTPNVVLTFLQALTLAMTTYTGMIYDIELINPSGVITRFVKGQFELDRAVTR